MSRDIYEQEKEKRTKLFKEKFSGVYKSAFYLESLIFTGFLHKYAKKKYFLND